MSVLSVTVHYRRSRHDYDGWELWVWGSKGDRDEGQSLIPLWLGSGGDRADRLEYRTPRRDAFGVLFRMEVEVVTGLADRESMVGRSRFRLNGRDETLQILPRWGEWFAEDNEDRGISGEQLMVASERTSVEEMELGLGEAHLYIVEGCPGLGTRPEDFLLKAIPRFVFVQVVVNGGIGKEGTSDGQGPGGSVGPTILAVIDDSGAREDVFPGFGSLDFVVDRQWTTGDRFGLAIAHDVLDTPSMGTQKTSPQAWWESNMGPRVVFNQSTSSLSPFVKPGQASVEIVGVSATVKIEESLEALVRTPSLSGMAPIHSEFRAKRIIVRYHRFDGIYDGWNLWVWVASTAKGPEQGLRAHAPRYGSIYNGAAVFSVDAPSLAGEELRDINIELQLENSKTGETDGPYTWKPSLGHDIFLMEGERELSPRTSAENFVTYTRLGSFGNWKNWRLKMWAEVDEQRKVLVRTFEIPPLSLKNDLSVLFDTSMAHFPRGTNVIVQALRVNEEGLVDLKACQHLWTSKVMGSHAYMVQGSTDLLDEEPQLDRLRLERSFNVSYRRHVGDYSGWILKVADEISDSEGFHLLPSTGMDETNGLVFEIDRSVFGSGRLLRLSPVEVIEGKIVSIEGSERKWSKEDLGDACFTNGQPLLLLQGHDTLVATIQDAIGTLRAYVDSEHTVTVVGSIPISWHHPTAQGDPPVVFKDRSADIKTASSIKWECLERLPNPLEVAITFGTVVFEEDYPVERIVVSLSGFQTVELCWRVYEDVDRYLYPGRLGWEYTPTETSFRCFAPTADSVFLVLYDGPEGLDGRREVPMRRIMQGCWKARHKGDAKGKFYKLLALGKDSRLFPGVEVLDPYSRCNTAHNGRCLVFGEENTSIADRPNIPAHQTIVCEFHIRDLTIDEASGVKRRGKYLGVTEDNTRFQKATDSGITTALAHVVEMNFTAVQILPVQDFDNHEEREDEYRWGYMPVHYNSPDGWYATERHTIARVTELKKMIDALHKSGLKVIMDVVYNHTAEDPNEFNLEARFSFNGLAPRYYYRTCGSVPVSFNGFNTCAWKGMDEQRCGTCYSNGSGCGNEFRSESPMGRKFLLDSLEYWALEYKIDGFRFDLVGLIDLETMTLAAERLHNIDQNIVLYGEPWTAGPSPVESIAKGMQKGRGFGVFNNTFRDALRGSPFNVEENFLMDGGRLSEVKRGIMGSIDDFAAEPAESVNYIECHDNRTLYDHFVEYRKLRDDSIIFTDSDFVRMQKLGAVVIAVSQGIAFFQIGQEMCRTKEGVENSYESPDSVNMIQWKWKVERKEVVDYHRGLIELRRKHSEIFMIKDADTIRQRLIFYEELGLPIPERCIGFRIMGEKINARLLEAKDENDERLKWTAVVVLLNPTPVGVQFQLPDGDKDVMWIPVVDDRKAGVVPVGPPWMCSVSVPGRSAMVLRRCSKAESRVAHVDLRLSVISDAFVGLVKQPVGEYSVGLSVLKPNAGQLTIYRPNQADVPK